MLVILENVSTNQHAVIGAKILVNATEASSLEYMCNLQFMYQFMVKEIF